MSATKRQSVKDWYDNTLFSRQDNKRDAVIILVMQRLHVDDLVAHVLEHEDWHHLNLPAIAESDEEFELSNGDRYTREPGEVLDQQREPRAVLDAIKNTIGTFNFSAQYQQQPIPEEGNLVRWPWFQFYDAKPAWEARDEIVQSWDTASKASELADYSVCTTWQIKGHQYYLLDVCRKRLEYPELRKAIVEQAQKFKARTILIEDTASGTALIQDIRSLNAPGLDRPIAVKPDDDKVMRLSRQSAKIEAGSVYLPRKAPWLDEFKRELVAFPQAAHDDQVDSLSQFLNWIDERSRRTLRQVPLSGI